MKELVTTYWSQVTLILLGIGYLIKHSMDISAKRNEAKFSIFQSKRIEAIEKYLTAYAKAEQMWWHLSVLEIFNNKYTPRQIDTMIFSDLNEVRSNALKLKLFLSNSEMSAIDQISERLFSINTTLSNLYFNDDQKLAPGPKSRKFHAVRESILDTNKEEIHIITQQLRSSYGFGK